MIIVLEKDWEAPWGRVKKAGMELVFHSTSELPEQIIEGGYGYPKMSLPEDLPGRKQLVNAGFDSLQSLRDVEFKEVKGIGKKTAEQITDYFKQEE